MKKETSNSRLDQIYRSDLWKEIEENFEFFNECIEDADVRDFYKRLIWELVESHAPSPHSESIEEAQLIINELAYKHFVEEDGDGRHYCISIKLDNAVKSMQTFASQQTANALKEARESNKFQTRVLTWLLECFGKEIARDIQERNHRFLEESLELVQSLGCTKEEAAMLVDYVFNRDKGEPYQELGGVMVTLAALCSANGLDMEMDGEIELSRINKPEIIDKIRKKQLTKPKGSPLPVAPEGRVKG